MKKSLLGLALLAPLMLLGGCKKKSPGPVTPPGPTPDPIDPTLKVTCNFYIDFNHYNHKTRYFQTIVMNDNLIEEVPPTPTEAPFEEFPVFLGWSTKEIVEDPSDIWNFATDKVESYYSTLSFYGIWVAVGD